MVKGVVIGGITGLALLTGGTVACSTTGPPTDTMATAEVALRKAEASLAAQYAPLELVMAREKLEKAKAAVQEDEYDQARRFAEQAVVEAQLAEEKARSAQAQQTAKEARRSIETLQEETGRYLRQESK